MCLVLTRLLTQGACPKGSFCIVPTPAREGSASGALPDPYYTPAVTATLVLFALHSLISFALIQKSFPVLSYSSKHHFRSPGSFLQVFPTIVRVPATTKANRSLLLHRS
jgi:hypothetical protein